MARLILLNGAPGTGKSTLARRYADEHPLTLALDVDVVRAMIGAWLERPMQAGLIARAMAIEMARVQLDAGRDVIVPQYLGRDDFVLQLEALCAEAGAQFVEIALMTDVEDVLARFARRSADPSDQSHIDADELLERIGGDAELRRMHARLLELIAKRPQTLTVRSTDSEADRAYSDLVEVIAQAGPTEASRP